MTAPDLTGLFTALDRLDAPEVDDDNLAFKIAEALQQIVVEVRNLRADVHAGDTATEDDQPNPEDDRYNGRYDDPSRP